MFTPLPELATYRAGLPFAGVWAYRVASLDLLRAMDADIVFFSPLRDAALPAVDSVYLPGGYPELHFQPLGSNTGMKDSLCAYVAAQGGLGLDPGGSDRTHPRDQVRRYPATWARRAHRRAGPDPPHHRALGRGD